MIALKSMTYAGKRIEAGDRFDAKTLRDAKILRAIGKAEDEEAPVEDVVDEPPKRVYRRKDMKAEG